jgi:hypothetical protein
MTSEIFNELAKHFDYVLIDSPPLLPVADALALGQITEATMIVVAAGQTRKRELIRAIEMLETVNAPVLGMVLNEVTSTAGYGYAYYDRYSYKYEEKPPGAHKKHREVGSPGASVLPTQEHHTAKVMWPPDRLDDETMCSGSTDDAGELHDRSQAGSPAPD